MGKKQRDWAGCGAPVAIIGREHCCLCQRKIREAAAQAEFPGCGKQRVLQDETGRCVLRSRCCRECGHPVRRTQDTLCRDCRRKARQAAARQPCPRCGRPGYLREDTGWCGHCSRPRVPKDPPRQCAQCGQVKRHEALGMCSACWQRRPDRPFIAGAGMAARLASPPDWLDAFIACLAASYSPSRSCQLITALGRLLDEDGQSGHPQALLERARWQAVDGFAASMLAARERARRVGTRPRSDHTIEAALSTMRDLALFLASERAKQDWALADVHDIEAFLAALPRGRKRRLSVLRQFFRFARSRKIILIDPARDLTAREPRGFTGQTLPLQKQRELFRRRTTGRDAHPHEALLGILALLHGASSEEVRHLRTDDIDHAARTARLGSRPLPVPLDPASWQALQRCLDHRESQGTANPHVMVTKGTKVGPSPASTAYVSHVLDGCGVPPRALRCTRLAGLVNTLDPKLVAAAFGMRPEGVMFYLADHVDQPRLAAAQPRPGQDR